MPAEGSVGTAFALTAAAGLATTIGALAPFVKCVDLGDRRILGAALACSAGVMLYVSFVEIGVKSKQAFLEKLGDDKEGLATMWFTVCFFSGIVLTWLLDMCVHRLSPRSHQIDVEEMERVEHNEVELDALSNHSGTAPAAPPAAINSDDVDLEHSSDNSIDTDEGEHDEKHQLNRMSLLAGLAIALHNFPEGLATFAAALNDPKVGAALATAIAIHNIPEGVVVSMPIYYSTGSKMRAFLWALLSGVSEPVGALLGYAVLVNFFDDLVYGILFGLVAGMMVWISLVELLPTAQRYDRHNKVVGPSLLLGMLVMAISLVIFAF